MEDWRCSWRRRISPASILAKVECLVPVLRQVDAEARGQRPNHRQRRRVRLGPEGPQLTQKDVHRDRSDTVEGEKPGFEIWRVACHLVNPPQTAVVFVDEHLAVAQ